MVTWLVRNQQIRVRPPASPPEIRACSSFGRAPALQAGGGRFESDQVHQISHGLSSVVSSVDCKSTASGFVGAIPTPWTNPALSSSSGHRPLKPRVEGQHLPPGLVINAGVV